MVFLACGEDPNFGPYSNHVRRALRNIITAQDATTGIMGMSMYHHGFATLALAEAYGAVDERNLWPDGKGPRSIGQALELAVRGAITSQKKNPPGAWRYSPDAQDADTSVSGAVLVGLLAARNAGIEVPDEAINKAITFYAQMTSASGEVAYAGGMGGFGESLARSSIATLVFSVARRKDLKQFKATLDYLKQRIDQVAAASVAGIRPLLRGPGTVSGRCGGLGEMEQAAGPATETGPGAPTAASVANWAARSARRCRSWHWRSIFASCRSTNDRLIERWFFHLTNYPFAAWLPIAVVGAILTAPIISA